MIITNSIISITNLLTRLNAFYARRTWFYATKAQPCLDPFWVKRLFQCKILLRINCKRIMLIFWLVVENSRFTSFCKILAILFNGNQKHYSFDQSSNFIFTPFSNKMLQLLAWAVGILIMNITELWTSV